MNKLGVLYVRLYFYFKKRNHFKVIKLVLWLWGKLIFSTPMINNFTIAFPIRYSNLDSFFIDGEIFKYYHQKKILLNGLSKKGLGDFTLAAKRYLSLISDSGNTQDESYVFSIKNHSINSVLKYNNSSVVIIGPLHEASNIDVKENEDVLYIKPSRCKIAKGSYSFYYVNSEDSINKLTEINGLLSEGLIQSVITTNIKLATVKDFNAVICEDSSPFYRAMALVIILRTLLLLGYKRVRLKGFSLYVGSRVYGDGYHSSLGNDVGKPDKKKFLKSLQQHDLLLNFYLLKSIISKFDDFKADCSFEQTINLSEEEYLNEFIRYNLQ